MCLVAARLLLKHTWLLVCGYYYYNVLGYLSTELLNVNGLFVTLDLIKSFGFETVHQHFQFISILCEDPGDEELQSDRNDPPQDSGPNTRENTVAIQRRR